MEVEALEQQVSRHVKNYRRHRSGMQVGGLLILLGLLVALINALPPSDDFDAPTSSRTSAECTGDGRQYVWTPDSDGNRIVEIRESAWCTRQASQRQTRWSMVLLFAGGLVAAGIGTRRYFQGEVAKAGPKAAEARGKLIQARQRVKAIEEGKSQPEK